MFVDNVMLFCHGDHASVDLLLDGIFEFGAISGLQTNKSKSVCFFSGMDATLTQYVLNLSEFQQGTLQSNIWDYLLLAQSWDFGTAMPSL